MTVSTVDRAEERLVRALLAVLTVVLVYAVAGAAGAAATAVLHWTGVALLALGIGLAVGGILRFRSDWAARDWALQAQHRAGQVAAGDSRAGIGYLARGSGGVRLQVCAVACLLLGTIITAIW